MGIGELTVIAKCWVSHRLVLLAKEMSKVGNNFGTKIKARLLAKNIESVDQSQVNQRSDSKVIHMQQREKGFKTSQHLKKFLKGQQADTEELLSKVREVFKYYTDNLEIITMTVQVPLYKIFKNKFKIYKKH